MPMFTPSEEAILQDMLVTEIAGGSQKVYDALYAERVIVWNIAACQYSCSSPCYRDLVYLQAQLGFIELAQGCVRNEIDLVSGRSNATGQTRYDSLNERTAQSQRTAQGTSCSWSNSTSFQQFRRDSESHDRSQSDGFTFREATSFENGSDRSRQQASGYGFSFDDATTRVDGDGNGFSNFINHHESQSYSCTGPMVLDVGNGPDIDGPELPTLGPLQLGNFTNPFSSTYLTYNPVVILGQNTGISFPDFSTWNILGWLNDTLQALWQTVIPVTYPTPSVVAWAAGPTGVQPVCPARWSDGCADIPSYGRMGQQRSSINISIPFIDVDFHIEWTESRGFDQDYVCTKGYQRTISETQSMLDYQQTNTASNFGRSEGHDQSTTNKDVVRHGEAHSRGEGKSDSVASGLMDSSGESRSGADRTAHGESQSSGQNTADMRSHFESAGGDLSTSEATAVSNFYSQLFTNLQEMWTRVFDEVREAQRRKSASVSPTVGRWKKALAAGSIKCAAPYRAFIDRQNNLCIPTCGCGTLGCTGCSRGRGTYPQNEVPLTMMGTLVPR